MNIWIIINSIIFGILLKIYDEIEDCNIYINNYIYLFIQITLIISLIIVCYNDKYILIFFTCLSILYLTNIFLKLSIYKNNDLIEIADALGDMLYILCGTIIEHGLHDKIETVFDEIQRSNMSKLGANGMPIYREDGKVMKGPNYFKPNIIKILKR